MLAVKALTSYNYNVIVIGVAGWLVEEYGTLRDFIRDLTEIAREGPYPAALVSRRAIQDSASDADKRCFSLLAGSLATDPP